MEIRLKRVISVLVRVLIVLFILSYMSFAQQRQGANVSIGDTGKITESSAGSSTAEGGNVTQLNLSVVISTAKWQGYYGDVSGDLALGLGSSYLYNFSGAVINAVYASQNASFNFSGIEEAAAADVDTQWGYTTASDTDQAADIYTGNTDIEGVLAPSVQLEPTASQWNSTILDCGATNDKSYYAFGINVQPGGNACFDGSNCQYELLVPADGVSSEVYYFFISIA